MTLAASDNARLGGRLAVHLGRVIARRQLTRADCVLAAGLECSFEPLFEQRMLLGAGSRQRLHPAPSSYVLPYHRLTPVERCRTPGEPSERLRQFSRNATPPVQFGQSVTALSTEPALGDYPGTPRPGNSRRRNPAASRSAVETYTSGFGTDCEQPYLGRERSQAAVIALGASR